MNDIPGVAGERAVCPLCRSTRSERRTSGGLKYRCSSCGALFDEHGARTVPPS